MEDDKLHDDTDEDEDQDQDDDVDEEEEEEEEEPQDLTDTPSSDSEDDEKEGEAHQGPTDLNSQGNFDLGSFDSKKLSEVFSVFTKKMQQSVCTLGQSQREKIQTNISALEKVRGFQLLPNLPDKLSGLSDTKGLVRASFNHSESRYLLVFIFTGKLGVVESRPILEIIEESQLTIDVVILTQQGTTSIAKKSFKNGTCERVDFFLESDFLINILECEIVPKQTRLDQEERKKFFRTNRDILPEQLPIMSISDPVCIINGWKEGDLIRSDRIIDTGSEKTPFYRIVSK
jgi:DNA-directed RNA polymerase subunit H (RpoH/RPB5)